MRMRPITFPRVFSVVHLVTLAFGMTKRPDAEVSQFISFEGRRRTRHGQRDPELRTGLRTANQIDAAVVRVHDLSHDAEAEPGDRKSTRLNSSHVSESRMPSSALKKKK